MCLSFRAHWRGLPTNSGPNFPVVDMSDPRLINIRTLATLSWRTYVHINEENERLKGYSIVDVGFGFFFAPTASCKGVHFSSPPTARVSTLAL